MAQAVDIVASVKPFIDSKSLAGAVTLVASESEILSLQAAGFADIAQQRPMQMDDLFWIASMSKPMTAAAVMMLVDEGKLSLDDPVEKYLPEFKDQMVVASRTAEQVVLKKPTRLITLRDILSHTSGMPFRSRIETFIDARPLREAVVSYAMTPLETEPGTKYQYSNAGINTAGRIIEVITGEAYERFMDERIFVPLGMRDTTFFPTEKQLARLAKSYCFNAAKNTLDEVPINQLSYPLSQTRYPCPAGGLFSTAHDAAVFGQMLLRGGELNGRRYLSKKSVREMATIQTADLHPQPALGYGLGCTIRKTPSDGEDFSVGSFGHDGAYATRLWIDPQSGLVTVFMVHYAGGPGQVATHAQSAFQKVAVHLFGSNRNGADKLHQ